MVNKKISKVIQKSIGVAMLLSAIVWTVPTMAANETRYAWSGTAASPGSNIKSGTETKKTAMYIGSEYISGSSPTVGVRVYAYTGTTYKDVTARTYNIGKNAGYFNLIANYAFEQGNCACKTYTVYTTSSAGNHAGRWIPDYK